MELDSEMVTEQEPDSEPGSAKDLDLAKDWETVMETATG
jgi:hypothetical protein